MKKYEIYVLGQDGKLHPTGIWARGYSFRGAELSLEKPLMDIDKPCTILISKLKPGVNDLHQRKI